MANVNVRYKKPRRTLTLPAKGKRSWKAAKSSLTAQGWLKYGRTVDSEIRYDLEALRARARQEAQNNDHVKHFLRLLRVNVVGKAGVVLQGRVHRRSNNAVRQAREQGARGGLATVGRPWRARCNRLDVMATDPARRDRNRRP